MIYWRNKRKDDEPPKPNVPFSTQGVTMKENFYREVDTLTLGINRSRHPTLEGVF